MNTFSLQYSPKPLHFTEAESAAANAEWGFNCGPGALCAVTGLKPVEIRPHLLDFESKRYTNPTLMLDILKGLQIPHKVVFRADAPVGDDPLNKSKFTSLCLVRIQWGGKWTKSGVPMRVRYRQTHWIAARREYPEASIFDVNWVSYGGWSPVSYWSETIARWLMDECGRGSDGSWWPTHVIEL